MTAEFDWWLLIVGLVIGAALVWLILAGMPRRDVEIEESEIGVEAAWIAAQLRGIDRRIDAGTVEAILREHRAYLYLPPPDDTPAAQAPAAPPVSAPAANGAAPNGALTEGPAADSSTAEGSTTKGTAAQVSSASERSPGANGPA